MVLLGTNLFQIFNSVFVPIFCLIVDHLWLISDNSSFKNSLRINCLVETFLYCSRVYFTFSKAMDKLVLRKNRVLLSLVGSSETGKSKLIQNWLQIEMCQPKCERIYFCYQHSQPLCDVMQIENENLEFVQSVNL